MQLITDSPQTIRERIAAVDFNYDAQPKDRWLYCNLCGTDADDWTRIASEDRYGFHVNTWICSSCGLVQLSPRMTAAAYRQFYERGIYRELIAARSGKPVSNETLAKQQLAYTEAIATSFATELETCRGRSLLDVGGSTGVTAGLLVDRLNLTGGLILEPAVDELEMASDLPTVYRQQGTLEDFETPIKFGLITMLQTVDHLLDLAGGLSKIWTWLAADGLFLVDAVNFALLANMFGVEQATKIDHPYGLNDATMRCYLAKAGFGIIRAGLSNDHRHLIYACRKTTPQPYAMPERVLSASTKIVLDYRPLDTAG